MDGKGQLSRPQIDPGFLMCLADRRPPGGRFLILPADLSVSKQKFYEYLSGWLGGPQLYVAKRGHPRLRMRHLPFPIGIDEVHEWLRCMGRALDAESIDGTLRAFLDERFDAVAHHMRNQ